MIPNAQFTALIADDEPLLREIMKSRLNDAWPQLKIIAQARNGRQAIELFEQHSPTVCFLDVHMPGVNGIEVARHIGRRSHLVFVTAFGDYALDAFDQGALDYLVKPVSANRLAETVERLKARLNSQHPVVHTDALIEQLAHKLELSRSAKVSWIRATVGDSLLLIAVEDIDYLKSDTKYTLVAFRDNGRSAEALVRTPLKELMAQLDPNLFVHVHRSVIVNLRSVRCIRREENGTQVIEIKGRSERLPINRGFLQTFKGLQS